MGDRRVLPGATAARHLLAGPFAAQDASAADGQVFAHGASPMHEAPPFRTRQSLNAPPAMRERSTREAVAKPVRLDRATSRYQLTSEERTFGYASVAAANAT